MRVTLNQIKVYPVKSATGIALPQAWVERIGLRFDRRFMVADGNGQFITGRTNPRLTEIDVSLQENGITLLHSQRPPLVLKYADFTLNEVPTNVFKDTFYAYSTTLSANAWFSHLLGGVKQLLFLGETGSPRVGGKTQHAVSFADGFPLMLISQASLDTLNHLSSETHLMAQFRPNIVVTGCGAFEEDTWAKIRIGSVYFNLDSSCTRCIFTTIDLSTGLFRANAEPLTTLSRFRTDLNGKINFGMNITTINEGLIKEGDHIDVLAYRVPEVYQSTQGESFSGKRIDIEKRNKEEKKSLSITINGEKFHGDNQGSLLLQAEEAGIAVDYHCRAGVCGRCKLHLLQGEVFQPDRPALLPAEKDEGWVLACSCVPKSDLILITEK